MADGILVQPHDFCSRARTAIRGTFLGSLLIVRESFGLGGLFWGSLASVIQDAKKVFSGLVKLHSEFIYKQALRAPVSGL